MTTAAARCTTESGTRLEWLAVLASSRSGAAPFSRTFGASTDWVLQIQADPGGPLSQSTAENHSCGVLFDGVLHNHAELLTSLRLPVGSTSARLVLEAYTRWGVEFTRHVKGIFALVISDTRERRLVAVRDPLGAYPLFYANDSAGRLLLSTSITSLAAHPGVDRSVNREALADHLAHRWPDAGETFFKAIRRVPAGSRLLSTTAGTRVEIYWDPAPHGEPVKWITEEELESFDDRLTGAVERATSQGRSGIFLSGGLDSIAVAALATDITRRSNRPSPIALSMGFPHKEGNEEPVQRGIAESLGIEQEFMRFHDAAPAGGLLSAVLDHTRDSPAPILNTWNPAYVNLALRGKRRGVEVILSGAGGDEWLTVSPMLTADMLLAGDVTGLSKFLRTWQRSYQMTPMGVFRSTFMTYGLRPVVGLALHRVAPKAWHTNRVRRLLSKTPSWIAPDPALRNELDRRAEASMTSAAPPQGFYFQDVRAGLRHPLASLELEEIFEMGRRLDVRFLHPYWDADIVDMLYRTPPLLLSKNGRAKGLIREPMARRFPMLGLDRQKKLAGTPFFKSILRAEVPKLWRSAGGVPALVDLGIVDVHQVKTVVEAGLTDTTREGLCRIWELLNLETWVQAKMRR